MVGFGGKISLQAWEAMWTVPAACNPFFILCAIYNSSHISSSQVKETCIHFSFSLRNIQVEFCRARLTNVVLICFILQFKRLLFKNLLQFPFSELPNTIHLCSRLSDYPTVRNSYGNLFSIFNRFFPNPDKFFLLLYTASLSSWGSKVHDGPWVRQYEKDRNK